MSYENEKLMNLEDGRELLKVLDGKKANADSMFLYKSALPGSVVEVEDAVAECVKQMQIEIAPVQDLHGYGKPWVGGAGKNLLDASAFETSTKSDVTFTVYKNAEGAVTKIHAQGTASSTAVLSISTSITFPYETIISGSGTNATVDANGGTYTSTIPANTEITGIRLRVGSGNTVNTDLYPMIRLASVADDTFEPYSNICPISGFDGCKIVRHSANMISDSDMENNGINSNNGVNQGNAQRIRLKDPIRVEAGRYFIDAKGMEKVNVFKYDLSGEFIGYIGFNPLPFVFDIDEPMQLRFIMGMNDNRDITVSDMSNVLLASGANQYSIAFPASAGTVYGGTLTLNQDGTGTLVVDRAITNFGEINWQLDDNTPGRFIATISDMKPCPESVIVYAGTDVISSHYSYSALSKTNMPDGTIRYNEQNRSVLFAKNSAYSTAEAFKEAGSGVSLCYPLANAASYSLTIDQVHLLLGYNTLYASTGSILSMLYPTSQVEAVANAKADGILEASSTPSAVMSFSDGADGMPMGVEVAIEPVQDLHGYDKPWVGGAGKNLLNPAELINKGLNSDGSESSSTNSKRLLSGYIPVTAGSTYYASCKSGKSFLLARFYNSSKTALGSGNLPTLPLTAPEGSAYLRVVYYENNSGDIAPADLTAGQVELGSSATTYEPYSNICPISGFDHAEVTRTGKNLVDVSEISNNKYLNGTGSLEVNNDCYVTGYIHFFAGQKIYIPATGTARRCTYDKNKKFVSYLNVSTAQVLNPNFEGYLRVSSRYDTLAVENIQIEYGESATEYETPDIKHYSITFPTSAGTVYGGTLKVNKDGSGVLVVDRAMSIANASNTTMRTGGFRFYYNQTPLANKTNVQNIIADKMPAATDAQLINIATAHESFCYIHSNTGGLNFNTIKEYASVAEMIADIGEIQFVYELATALTYTLPAPIIKSLLGQNNIWADIGDINSAEWSADTKSYIDNLFSSITSAEGQTF